MRELSLFWVRNFQDVDAKTLRRVLFDYMSRQGYIIDRSIGALIEARARINWAKLLKEARWPVGCRILVIQRDTSTQVRLSLFDTQRLLDVAHSLNTYRSLFVQLADGF